MLAKVLASNKRVMCRQSAGIECVCVCEGKRGRLKKCNNNKEKRIELQHKDGGAQSRSCSLGSTSSDKTLRYSEWDVEAGQRS